MDLEVAEKWCNKKTIPYNSCIKLRCLYMVLGQLVKDFTPWLKGFLLLCIWGLRPSVSDAVWDLLESGVSFAEPGGWGPQQQTGKKEREQGYPHGKLIRTEKAGSEDEWKEEHKNANFSPSAFAHSVSFSPQSIWRVWHLPIAAAGEEHPRRRPAADTTCVVFSGGNAVYGHETAAGLVSSFLLGTGMVVCS